MIKKSEVLAIRAPEHSVDSIFPQRWSSRAMSGEEITDDELFTLFEAARWAPSSYNNQPWRFLYARRNTPHWDSFFDLLGDYNKSWAINAAALVVIISKSTFDHNGKPSLTHSYDTGAAWGYFALQGSMNGLVTHGMQGFDYDKARTVLAIPDDYTVEAMAAVGKPGDGENLPENLRKSERPNSRKAIQERIIEGPFHV